MEQPVEIVATTRCPLCGERNACALADARRDDAPCWCADQHFPPELLARIPARAAGRACVCRNCLERQQVDGESA